MSCRDPSDDACALARHAEHVEGRGSSVCRGGYKGRRTTLMEDQFVIATMTLNNATKLAAGLAFTSRCEERATCGRNSQLV